MLIDATDLIVGRMGTVVAKKALLGEKVEIINCEKAVITGSKENIIARFKQKKEFGTPKGPYLPRMPDRLVRRMIRGMMHHRTGRGKEAYNRIMCYVGVPSEFEGKKAETIKEANVSKLSNLKFVHIDVVTKFLGAKQ